MNILLNIALWLLVAAGGLSVWNAMVHVSVPTHMILVAAYILVVWLVLAFVAELKRQMRK